ncbi:hypothetical protein K461DRAFT_295388 [Myriangium duriaei CBS 260.36]|uniref:Transcription initiation factor TFIID subunit 1 histone acetyltransferase domain-containing protein n=1 Tax=Myriangium duriaei CBS 260.36 TaxID=1168546 RepID=A0A9P4IZ31_9PEZI|nr:hypothetical protein K461DRAFT_295388 [Myriangium duriaei CBS 260.36]
MPHATDGDPFQEGQDDDSIIARLLNNETSGQPNDALDFMGRDLEVGEKADDAQDFEDISDDDLASDDDEGGAPRQREHSDTLGNSHAATQMETEADDDLFGDEDNGLVFGGFDQPEPSHTAAGDHTATSSFKPSIERVPRIALPGTLPTKGLTHDGLTVDSPASYGVSPLEQDFAQQPTDSATPEPAVGQETVEEELDDAVALQRALFARAGRRSSQEPPDAPETDMELFFSIWPSYDPEKTARFTELFPPPRGTFNWKAPPKPPKALNVAKINLDIAPDAERSFRTVTTAPNGKVAHKPEFEQPNLIRASRPQDAGQSSGDELDMDDRNDDELVGGFQWKDIELACCDWDVMSVDSLGNFVRRVSPQADSGIFMDLDLDADRPTKRQKLDNIGAIENAATTPLFPSLDDPELSTQKLSKRIALDAHDPDLLIDETLPRATSKKRSLATIRAEAKDTLAKDLTRRYNISNDNDYELLKENHQHKVRSTLGNVLIEHGMPAVKLQYPFYKVKLEPKQLRLFHRPQFGGVRVGRELRFSKPKTIKKKHLRGREPRDIFAKSEDLSMGDNSSGLLLEYSEESPMMLSNFGMGNKIVNFYRRKDDQDSARPKEDIGETQVLLPQDRSPFANFGHVDPGELVPAVQNFMYRAPIFKHEGRHTDFLVACSTTSEHGNRFFLRNLENLHVVGQQFPSTEIPGEHSRKVTDAAKRRLKAISYRVWRKWSQRRGEPLTNQVVQAHLPGSDIAQNRGKMREFMKYDKNNSIWVPKDNDTPPDSNELRAMIKPEDICLLDSMQAGVQHLNDLGLRRDEEVNDDDDDKEGTNIELLLAPWSTTKNFMNACQGKAMLQLHGEGDPTGRGEGFSFIKTSMKGGFRALGESIEERLDAKKLKENHGHSYNVAKQQKAYDESIRRIWRAQQESLSSRAEHSDMEVDIDDEPEDGLDRATTPRTGYATPSFSRREDESVSQFSRNSLNRKNQTLIIDRWVRGQNGNLERHPEVITDARVISAYKKAKFREKSALIDPMNIQKTGDKEYDALQIKAAQAELDRVMRSKERREARERQKGIFRSSSAAGSPAGDDGDDAGPGTPHGAGPGTGKRGGRKKVNPEGTGRRCANCGQVGHIKTNKKSVHFSLSVSAGDDGESEREVCDECREDEQRRAEGGFGFVGKVKRVRSRAKTGGGGGGGGGSGKAKVDGGTESVDELCPMLNGTMRPEDIHTGFGGGGGPPGATPGPGGGSQAAEEGSFGGADDGGLGLGSSVPGTPFGANFGMEI